MSAYTKDINAFVLDINETIKNVPKYLTNKLDKHSKMMVNEVKRRTPVDTGNLKNSWRRSEVERHHNTYSVTISNNARNPKYGTQYASFVEFGHYSTGGNWVNGRFMLMKSQLNAQVKLEQDLRKDQVILYSKLL